MSTTKQKIIQAGDPILVTRPVASVQKSTFKTKPERVLSSNVGKIYPIFNVEVVGGSSFHIRPEGFHRLAPMVAPPMGRMNVRTFWFFVPWRIIWPNFEGFIADRNNPDLIEPAMPFFTGQQIPIGSLGDYLTLPTNENGGATPTIDKFNALQHYAYHRVLQDWFWPEQLGLFSPIEAVDGDNNAYWNNGGVGGAAINDLWFGLWDLDYFTSNMPWAQKGAAVTIPLTGTALPVSLINTAGSPQVLRKADMSAFGNSTLQSAPDGVLSDIPTVTTSWLDPNGSLGISAADVAQYGGNINDLRTASAIQRFLELEALGGTRYQEYLWTIFGSNAGDARLNRPEYLGSTFQPMSISEVAQTSESAATPQGNLAGRGVSGKSHDSIHYSAPEHGLILGVQLTNQIVSYHQGLPRFFNKFDKFDFLQPPLANIGSRPTLNQEVYYDYVNKANNPLEFGYLPQYSEYRVITNQVTGQFRSSLGYWTFKRSFANLPQLTTDFMLVQDPVYDIFAVTDPSVDHIYSQWVFDVSMTLPLPKYVDPHLY